MMGFICKKCVCGAAVVAMAGMISAVGAVPVLAQYNQKEEAAESPVAEVVKEENKDGTPFSVAGNGEVVDDISNDEMKQFITVRTKNNQTFFVVIDRANTVDNVYMLSMIDEEDLEEFLKDAEDDEVLPSVEIPGKSDGSMELGENGNPIEDNESVDTKKKSGGSNGMLFAAIGFVGLFAVGYYYFKFGKNKKNSGGQSAPNTENAHDEDEGIEYDEYEEDDAEEYDDEEYEDGEYDDEDYEEDSKKYEEYEEEDDVEEEAEEQETEPSVEDNTEDYYEDEDEEPKTVARRRRRRKRR